MTRDEELENWQEVASQGIHIEHELRCENERLENALSETVEALQRIENWSQAYPVDIFPEPDFKKARALLAAGGMTLDSISAYCMRHVIKGVGEIAREALAATELKQNENLSGRGLGVRQGVSDVDVESNR